MAEEEEELLDEDNGRALAIRANRRNAEEI
jgi:hypothetical protein